MVLPAVEAVAQRRLETSAGYSQPRDRLHARLEPVVHAQLDQQVGDAAAYGPQADAEGPGDLLVLRAVGQLLQQEPAQVGAGLAEVQSGTGSGPVPHQLEQQVSDSTSAALPDQDPRLVGHAERLGQHGVGGPDARTAGSAGRRSPAPARRPGPGRAARPAPPAAPGRGRSPATAGRRRPPRPTTLAIADSRGIRQASGRSHSRSPRRLLDDRGEQLEGVAAGADLAVERLDVLDLTRPGAGGWPRSGTGRRWPGRAAARGRGSAASASRVIVLTDHGGDRDSTWMWSSWICTMPRSTSVAELPRRARPVRSPGRGHDVDHELPDSGRTRW